MIEVLLGVTHSCQADAPAVEVLVNQPSILGALYMDSALVFAAEEVSWVSEGSWALQVWAEGQEASRTCTRSILLERQHLTCRKCTSSVVYDWIGSFRCCSSRSRLDALWLRARPPGVAYHKCRT